jgi:uncharacterized protein (TIGR01370 family)
LGLAPGAAKAQAAALEAESFLYQTRDVDLAAVAQSDFGTVILDPSRDGTAAGDWTPAEIDQLKLAGKMVLAVVKIAEAESSRHYWDPLWLDPKSGVPAPSWLGEEDPDRPGIYRVRYWDPLWQQLLVGSAASIVDRLLAQGFDGMVLDAVDAHLYWGPDGKLPTAERNPNAVVDMIALVQGLAAYTRALSGNPSFAVLPQNGASLAADAGYVATISGVVAESTWFVGAKRQKTRHTRTVVPFLDRIHESGKPVFAVDYTTTEKNIDTLYDRAESKGYIPLATTPERNFIPENLRHPPNLSVPFVPLTPEPFSDVRFDVIPTFTWSDPGTGTLAFRIRFSGSESRQQVFTFPKTGVLQTTQFTPKPSEWRWIVRRARDNYAGRLFWWITTEDINGTLRSSPAQIIHRLHADVPTTIFWVGAAPGQAGIDARTVSAWDADWVSHFGGVDDPFSRDPLNPYWPAAFTPLENPFYLALPYDDFGANGLRRPNYSTVIPWARFAAYGPLESAVKNRWVKLVSGEQTCYAQWEDVGPLQDYDFRYVFGTNKPRNKENLGSGMEISPAVAHCLGVGGISGVSWRFVYEDEVLPSGPWTDIVTSSQITPPPE